MRENDARRLSHETLEALRERAVRHVSAADSQSGGLCAKARVYWDICPLKRRQRILDEDALAEGEELDSNILSQSCEVFRVGSLRSRSAATHPIGILRPVVMGMPCWSEAR
jgi:hypothetical protein